MNNEHDNHANEEYSGSHRVAEDSQAAGSTAVAAGGLPKRGLAMVLIAVAAILLLWGLYALTADKGGETTAQSSATTAATAPGSASASGNAQSSSASATATSPAPATAPATTPAQAPAQATGEGLTGGLTGGLTRANAQVLVYNNSAVPARASETARELSTQYTVANQSADAAAMNLPEQQYGVFDTTYVFYNPSVAGAGEVAADVAKHVGGTARAVTDLPAGASLPGAATANGNAVTVVLAG
ncbi:hypothetical protein CAPI_08375 [Corynebacterium capitovis DSM 44611]|nr:hypothetical protein CAPI_08375 [Corynebacterium capitovis DSM 44611]